MYKNLTFPLNVYANLLALDKQPVDYLHFGLFENSSQEVGGAQKNSTDKIFSYLPNIPAEILEVGIGLGTTQKLLLDNGYQSVGITPDMHQISIAQQRLGGRGNLVCEFLEKYERQKGFDVILFQESAQYIKLPELVDKTNQLSGSNGRIIIIDEVCLRPDLSSNLHHPQRLIEAFEKVDINLVTQEDLSALAKPTMNYIQDKLQCFHSEILEVLEQDKEKMAHLKDATQQYIEKYDSGDYGYWFFVFDKNKI